MDTVNCAGIEVSHADHLDGGGPRTWPYFVEAVRNRVGAVGHAFEWCAGPGYIGFALLGAGLCERLTLADINPDAVAACQDTIERHNLSNRVSVYLSDNLRDIPAHEHWDFVIADPPHFETALPRHLEDGFEMRSVDEGWALHREFFRTLPSHLNPDARLLLSESRVAGDHDEMFIGMMREGGFQLETPVWEHGYNNRYCLLGRFK